MATNRPPEHEVRELQLPQHPLALLDINLPQDLVQALVGERIEVEVQPAEPARRRRLAAAEDGELCLVDRDGTVWNDERPVRVSFLDGDGHRWWLPRHWLDVGAEPPWSGPPGEGHTRAEILGLPGFYDLREINITSTPVLAAQGRAVTAIVWHAPQGFVRVALREGEDTVWYLPSGWRRRRVELPAAEYLLAEDIPPEVAASCAHRVVTVNYHRGSVCCLPAHYRFRDDVGRKWPVPIDACTFVGFAGDDADG